MPFSRFCKDCKINCCEFTYYFDGLLVTESEKSVMKRHLDRINHPMEWQKDGNLFFAKINGQCPFQSKNRPFLCEIWDDRPVDCRVYPVYFFPQKKILKFDVMCKKIPQIINTLEHPEEYDGFDLINYINQVIGTYMTVNSEYADLLFDLEKSLPTTVLMKWDKWEKNVNLSIDRSRCTEIVKEQKI